MGKASVERGVGWLGWALAVHMPHADQCMCVVRPSYDTQLAARPPAHLMLGVGVRCGSGYLVSGRGCKTPAQRPAAAATSWVSANHTYNNTSLPTSSHIDSWHLCASPPVASFSQHGSVPPRQRCTRRPSAGLHRRTSATLQEDTEGKRQPLKKSCCAATTPPTIQLVLRVATLLVSRH